MEALKRSKIQLVLAAAVLVSLVALAGATGNEAAEPLVFTDAESQSAEFIEYYHSIQLTDAQEATKREALSPLPAPCCSDNSAYTCCCPCNLSKTIWGLSARLITAHDADAETVRSRVEEWIAYVNPDGFSGNVCTTAGGCPRPFAENGCGGMHGEINWGHAH